MTDNTKKLYELISGNEEFKKELDDLNSNYKDVAENKQKLVELAAKYGITLTEEDFKKENVIKEMSIDELENIDGGGIYKKNNGYYYSDCCCFIGGGGTGDFFENTCACVVGGGGTLTSYGQELFYHDHLFACVVAGSSLGASKMPGYENVWWANLI